MARISNFEVGAVYVKGGLASDPPLASPELKPVGGTEGQGLQAPGTPKSLASTTAPNTPLSCFSSPFLRQVSGDSLWTDDFKLDDLDGIDEETNFDESPCDVHHEDFLAPRDAPELLDVREHLLQEALISILLHVAEVNTIPSLSCVAKSFNELLKSDLTWAGKAVHLPANGLCSLSPFLSPWLPSWRLASKLIIPNSNQLIQELKEQDVRIPLELAWRFDGTYKGDGVEVINHGRSVQRRPGATEELVVLGDAPLSQTTANAAGDAFRAPYLEIILDDRSAEVVDDLNDFGIGITACPPSDMREIGAVACEVPSSWVVDFSRSSVTLTVNNIEVAKSRKIFAGDLGEGDRVGLRVTEGGSIEIFFNGEFRDRLVPPPACCVPSNVELFPVLDLYGCTAQLSRTLAEMPR